MKKHLILFDLFALLPNAGWFDPPHNRGGNRTIGVPPFRLSGRSLLPRYGALPPPPKGGEEWLLPRQSDGSPGYIVCKAAHTDPNAELFWHLDNAYIGSTTAIHHQKIRPEAGYHRLTVVDNHGHSITLPIIIR